MAYNNQNTPEQLNLSQKLRQIAYQNYINQKDSVTTGDAISNNASGSNSTGFGGLKPQQTNKDEFYSSLKNYTAPTLSEYEESGFVNNTKNALRDIMADVNRVSADHTKGVIVSKIQPGIKKAQRALDALDKLEEVRNDITRVRAELNQAQDPTTKQALIERLNVYNSERSQLEQLIPAETGFTQELSDYSGIRDSLHTQIEDLGAELKEAYDDIATDEQDIEDWKQRLGDTDDYWKNMRADNPNFEFSNAASWSNVPSTIGSSSSAIVWQLAPFAAEVIAPQLKKSLVKLGAKASVGAAVGSVVPGAGTAAGGTIGTIVGIGSSIVDLAKIGFNTYSAFVQGENEAGAEVFSNYRERVSKDYVAQGGDINTMLAVVKEDPNNAEAIKDKTDDQILDMVMDGRVQYTDEIFEQVKDGAAQDTRSLYQQNLAITTAGNILANQLYLPTFAKVIAGKTTGNVVGKAVTNANVLFDPITWGIERGLSKATKAASKYLLSRNSINAATKLAKAKNVVSRYATIPLSLAAKRGVEMISEAGEEGAQYLSGKQYQANDIDGEITGISGALRDYAQGFSNRMEVYGMMLGVYNNPLYSSDMEFWNNVKLGAAASLVSAPSAISLGTDVYGSLMERKGVNFVRGMAADEFAAKETLLKVQKYGSIKNGNKQQGILDAMVMLSESDSLPEGVTKEDVKAEIEFAKNVFGTANSNRMKELAKQIGISENSAEYNDLVTLALDAKNSVTKAQDQHKLNNTEFTSRVNQFILANIDTISSAINTLDLKTDNQDLQKHLVNVLEQEVIDELRGSVKSTLGLFNEDSSITDNRVLSGNKYAKAQLNDFSTRLTERSRNLQNTAKDKVNLDKAVSDLRAKVSQDEIDQLKTSLRNLVVSGLNVEQAHETYRAFNNPGTVGGTLSMNLANARVKKYDVPNSVKKQIGAKIADEYNENGNELVKLLFGLHQEAKQNSNSDLNNIGGNNNTQKPTAQEGKPHEITRTPQPEAAQNTETREVTPVVGSEQTNPEQPLPEQASSQSENGPVLGTDETNAYSGKRARKSKKTKTESPVVTETPTDTSKTDSLTEEQIRAMLDEQDTGVMPDSENKGAFTESERASLNEQGQLSEQPPVDNLGGDVNNSSLQEFDPNTGNGILHTFHYDPTATDVQPRLVVNGQEVEFSPNSELPDVLLDEGSFIESQYVISGGEGTNWSDPRTWDNVQVHIVLHNPKTGRHYLTTMKLPNVESFSFMPLEEQAARIPQLREIRNNIISQFVADGVFNPNITVRPTKVVFHQRVVGERFENGTPMYRNMLSLDDRIFQFDEDLDMELDNFAYGTGLRDKGIQNTIVYMNGLMVTVDDENGETRALSSPGSGTIYYVISEEKRPNGRLLPVQLRMKPYVGNTSLTRMLAQTILNYGFYGNDQTYNGTELRLSDILAMFLNYGSHTLFDPNSDVMLAYDEQIAQNPELRQEIEAARQRYISNMSKRQLFVGEQNSMAVLIFGETTIPLSQVSSENIEDIVEQLAAHLEANASFPFTTPDTYTNRRGNDTSASIFGVNNNNYDLTMGTVFNGRIASAVSKSGGTLTLPGGLMISNEDLGKSPLSWMIKSGLIQTDLNEKAYLTPYVIAEGIASSTPLASAQGVQEQTSVAESASESLKTAQDADLAAFDSLFDELEENGANFTVDEDIEESPIHSERGRYLKEKLGLTDDQIEIVEVGMAAENAESAVSHMLLDSIVLSTGDPISAEYHEAFHRVSLLLLSNSMRQRVYETFRRKNPGLKHLTDKQIEEKLAEQYRFYVMNRTAKSFYGITKWFDTLVGFMDVLRGGANINYLFSKIHSGKYAGMPVNADSAARFKEAYGNRANFTKEDVEYKHVATLDAYEQAVNFFTMTLVRRMWEANQNVEDITKFSINYEDVRKMLAASQKSTRITDSQKTALQEILDNFDNFRDSIALRLQSLGLNEIYKEQQDQFEDDLDSGDTTREGLDKYDLVDYEVDRTKTIRPVVKMLLSSLVVGDMSMVNPHTGLPMLPSFDEAWKQLTNELYSADSWGELINLTQQLAEVNGDQFFQSVNKRLRSIKNVNLQTQIFQQLTGHRHAFLSVGFINKGGWRNPSYEVIVNGMLDEKNARNKIKEWGASYAANGLVIFDENGVQVYNKALLKVLKSEWDGIVGRINKLKNATSTNEDINKSIAEVVNFLERIGIKVDPNTVDATIYSKLASIDGVKNPNGKNKISVFKNLFTSSSKGTPGRSISSVLINPSLDKVSNVFGGEEGILAMAITYNKLHQDTSVDKTYGPKGKSIYPLAKHNYITTEFKKLNNDRNYVRKLLEVETNKGSVVLNKLAADPTLRLKVHTLINITEWYSGNSGVDYQHAPDIETFIAKFVLSENDILLLPTMSDKKKYQPISGIKLFSRNAVSFSIEDGKAVARFNPEVIDIFYKYYLSEYNSVAQYYQLKEKDGEISDSNRIRRYIGEKGKDGNGGKFRIAKGYYDSTGQYHDFNKMSWDEVKEYFSNTEQVKADISNLLRKETEIELNRLTDMGILKKNRNGRYKNVLLPKPSLNQIKKDDRFSFETSGLEGDAQAKNDAAIYQAIAGFTVNNFISMVEAEKIIFKDPAFYKNFDDIIKRLAGALSTGDRGRTDFSPNSWFMKIPRYSKGKFKVVGIKDIMTREQQALDIYDAVYRAYVTELLEQDGNFTVGEIKAFGYSSNLYEQLSQEYKAYSESKDKDSVENRTVILSRIHDTAKSQTESDLKLYGNIKLDENGDLNLKEYFDGVKNAPVNQADASVYVSPQMYKAILFTQGELSNEVEEAIDYIEAHPDAIGDKETYIKALNAVLRPRKMVYYGNDIIEVIPGIKLNTPIFNKMAVFPLFKATATGDLRAMYDRMTDETDPIDMITTESAVKVGNTTEYDFYDNVEQENFSTAFSRDEHNNYSKLASRLQNFSNLFNQMPVEPHEEERRMLVTQAMKNVYSNIRLDGEYFLPDKTGNRVTPVTGQQLADLAMSAINELSDRGLKQILKQFDAQKDSDGNFNFRSLKGLSKKLQRDAENANMSPGIIAALGLNNKGEFNVPLSALSVGRQMVAKLISAVNKSVIDINLPGGSYVQMSSFGLKASNEDVLRSKAISYRVNKGRRLNMKNVDGSMDAVITINSFKHIIPDYDNKTFMESRQWLIDAGIIGHPEDRKDNSETITASIGYRVPSQGPSSIASLKVRDVLPSNVGDIVVLPDSFTARTGSDFDIDKLFLARYNFTEDGKKIQFKIPSDLSKDSITEHIKSASSKQLENLLMDTFFGSLLDYKNMHDAFKPIDVPIDAMKQIANDYYHEESDNEAFAQYRASYHDRIKSEYAMSVDGIGPFALNLPQHVLSQMVQLTLDNVPEGYEMLRNLHKTTGVDGIHIVDWLSAMISAHVDVAKDNYIIRLNVNPYTYNIVNLLLRAGAGKNTMFFVMQDIIRDLAKASINSKGKYGVGATTGGFKIAQNKIFNKYYNSAKKLASKEELSALEALKEVSEVSIDMLFEPQPENGKTLLEESLRMEKNTFNYYYNQLYAFKMFDRLGSIAAAMSELVSATQIDTKKTGKNALQMRDFLTKVRELKRGGAGYFRPEVIDRFFNDTFLQKKLENGTEFLLNLLSPISINAKQSYYELYNSLLRMSNLKNLKTTHAQAVFTNALDGMWRAKALYNEHTQDLLFVDVNGLSEMFFGDNTMARRLNKIMTKIRAAARDGKKAYPEVDIKFGKISNLFLNSMTGVTTSQRNSPEYITINANNDMSTDQAQQIRDYWQELTESSDTELREFANDLIKYAIFTGHGSQHTHSLFDFIPTKELERYGYYDKVRAMENMSEEEFYASFTEEDIDEIYRNNWSNDDLVPKFYSDISDDGGLEGDPQLIEYVSNFFGKPQRLAVVPKNAEIIGRNEDNVPIYSPFIKVANYRAFGNNDLFKYVGTYVSETNNGLKYQPLYILVNKKGFKEAAKAVVTEYTSANIPKDALYNPRLSLLEGNNVAPIVNGQVFEDNPEAVNRVMEAVKKLPIIRGGHFVYIDAISESTWGVEFASQTIVPIENRGDNPQTEEKLSDTIVDINTLPENIDEDVFVEMSTSMLEGFLEDLLDAETLDTFTTVDSEDYQESRFFGYNTSGVYMNQLLYFFSEDARYNLLSVLANESAEKGKLSDLIRDYISNRNNVNSQFEETENAVPEVNEDDYSADAMNNCKGN